MRGTRRPRGFTIMEILVVIVVLGVVASMALPRLQDRQAEHELAVRDNLRQMLRLARQLAVARQTQQGVCLTIGPTQLALVHATAAGCNGAALVVPGGTGGHVFDLPPGTAVTGSGFVRFDAAGQPMNLAGTAALNANLTLTIGNLAVTVQRQTGFVN